MEQERERQRRNAYNQRCAERAAGAHAGIVYCPINSQMLRANTFNTRHVDLAVARKLAKDFMDNGKRADAELPRLTARLCHIKDADKIPKTKDGEPFNLEMLEGETAEFLAGAHRLRASEIAIKLLTLRRDHLQKRLEECAAEDKEEMRKLIEHTERRMEEVRIWAFNLYDRGTFSSLSCKQRNIEN